MVSNEQEKCFSYLDLINFTKSQKIVVKLAEGLK